MGMLDGKVVIVTGASAGIGEAAASRLTNEGATLVISARRADRLEAVRQQIESVGGRALAMAGDITSSEDRERLVLETMREFGRIDGLVNNAGYGQRGPIELVPLEAIRQNFETNVFSLIGLTQLVIPIMRRQGGGRIINISSVAGRIARPMSSVYDATKHALEAISDGLRGELAQFGVKVVIIEPGMIVTEFVSVADANVREIIDNSGPYKESFERAFRAIQRMRRMAGRPQDIAEVICRALTANNPKPRYAAPGHARFAIAAKRMLPARLFEYVLSR